MNAETSTQRPVIRLEIPKKSKNDAKKSEMPAALNQNEGRTVVLVKSVRRDLLREKCYAN